MATTFHDALIWHMKMDKTKISDLAKGSGVSEGAIKQIRTRPGGGTGAANAAKIAAYYGKTLEAFMRCEDTVQNEETFVAMFSLLTEEEREILLRQVRGMIAGRG